MSDELKPIDLPGLPEGVVAVGYRIPSEVDRFYLAGRCVFEVHHGVKYDPMLIVQPAQGFSFESDAPKGAMFVTKTFPKPKTICVEFEVFTSRQLERVKFVRGIPGFVSMRELPDDDGPDQQKPA